jgi:hypothetical protein
MLPTQALLNQIATLLGADTTTFAEATPFVALHLAKAAFTPGPTLAIGDLTEADFTGYAALHAASAATQVFRDPVTGRMVVQVREPAGGWHFACTGTPVTTQIIYGWYLTSADGSTLHAADVFDPAALPQIKAIGDAVDVDQVRCEVSQTALV